MSPFPDPSPRRSTSLRPPGVVAAGVEILVDAVGMERDGDEQVLLDPSGSEVARLPDAAVLSWRLRTQDDL